MFKRVIALSTAAILLLSPMSASAVTWGEVVNGLNTSNTFKKDGLTATKDGDNYTFEGGQVDDLVDINSYVFGKDGKFYFNGVQFKKMDIFADGSNYYVVLDKDTEAGEFVFALTNADGKIELVNEGTIGSGDYPGMALIESSHLTNKGTLKAGEGSYCPKLDDQSYHEDVPNVSGYAQGIVESGTQAEAEKLVDQMYSFDTPGTYTIVVTLEWGEHIQDFIVTRTVEAETVEEAEPAEEVDYYREMMEEKRRAEAIGGVTGSPYWVKQMYLGHNSYNLRLYIDGEPVLMRERLSWNGHQSKGITLRVNTVAPEKLTMRLDEKTLEVFERTNITTVTLVDKENTPVMQYNVSDLRAVYDQYGLDGEDLLVVGGVDDDVMKIGADGQLVPVE